MKKKLMALAAVATLAVSAMALPQAAEARGGRIAAGVAAGLIGGALWIWAWLLWIWARLRLLWRPGLCRGRLLRLAATAFLGRLWLASAPGACLRLSPVHLPYKHVRR